MLADNEGLSSPAEAKETMRALFEDMDYYVKKATAKAKIIKELAPIYWKAQGIGPGLPRLEALRQDVFKED